MAETGAGAPIFERAHGFNAWIAAMYAFALGCVGLGFATGEVGPLFTTVGVMWLVVGTLVALIVAAAGGGMVTALRREGQTLRVTTAGLFGAGRETAVPFLSAGNWRWETQRGSNRVRYRQVMLIFDHAGRAYRIPLVGASHVEVEALRALSPAVVDDMVAQNADMLRPLLG